MTEKLKKTKGNPNPSPATRFGAGNKANPNGKTSEQKRLEYANAEAAMRIRERILRAAEARLVECSTDEVLDQFVEAAMLKLIKDSEDRGLGAPVQQVDNTSSDGSMSPRDVSAAVLEALKAKHGTGTK